MRLHSFSFIVIVIDAISPFFFLIVISLTSNYDIQLFFASQLLDLIAVSVSNSKFIGDARKTDQRRRLQTNG